MTVQVAAVLGGGIMGSCIALELARRGIRSVMFEEQADIFNAASRWNEGKIHLGYLYSADRDLATAKSLIPAGIAFKPIVEELLDQPIIRAATDVDDVYLCHEDSVVGLEAMDLYFRMVSELIREHPACHDYFTDLASARTVRLSASELDQLTPSKSIIGGFRLPERSVSTNWLADKFVAAVRSNGLISTHCGMHVSGAACKDGGSPVGPWYIDTTGGRAGPFDAVFNALWQGKLAIDAVVGLPLPAEWTHRYRLSVFLRMSESVSIPNAVIATGPFGDIKNYDGHDLYMSWYPSGLRQHSNAVIPAVEPPLTADETRLVLNSIAAGLGEYFPATGELLGSAEQIQLRGGWVYAASRGLLSDPKATIHNRSNFGVTRHGTYFSIDTGKYSVAPWLARKIVSALAGSRQSTILLTESPGVFKSAR